MDKSRKYHVYVHHRESDGEIFYVGKAAKSRATNTTHRSEWWKRVYNKHGRKVRYIKRYIPEACALSFERALIYAHGRENLCNLCDGGMGVTRPSPEARERKSKAFSRKNNPYFDSNVYAFWHPKFGTLKCTKLLFRKITGGKSPHVSSLVSGKAKSLLGWVMLKNKGLKGGKSGPNSATRKIFDKYKNDDGREWFGNPYDFRKKYNLNKTNVYKLRTGRIECYKGWRIMNRPADDDGQPDFVLAETEKMRRMAA